MTEDWEDDETEWGVGVYPAFVIEEPEGQRLTKIAESRRAAQKLWETIQENLRRDR